MAGIAAISGVVRKDGVAVEGAKVYILHDGEVVSSGESDESGEYSCGGLSLDNKYHAVVEYEEVDGDDIIHYSAKSMPGIEPISGIVYLYNEGEGIADWVLWQAYVRVGYVELEAPGGTYEEESSMELNADLTDVNYIVVEYLKGEDRSDYNYCSLEVPGITEIKLPYVATKTVAKLNVSSLSGSQTIKVASYQYEYSNNPIWVYKVWLE